jgi:hypothetical protein
MTKLTKFVSGVNTNFSTELNQNFSSGWSIHLKNHIRQLIDRAGVYSKDGTDLWGEAYTSAGGRNSSVATADTNAIFDTNKYKAFDETAYVIIQATSVNESAFNINNCKCFKFDTDKWVVFCTTGTNEVKRAQIYRTLFVGSLASNAYIPTSPITASVTGLVDIYTSISRDVDKRVYFMGLQLVGIGGDTQREAHYTATFANTTDNLSISPWSAAFRNGGNNVYFQFPVSTTIRTDNSGSGWNDYGTNRTADEKNNQTNIRVGIVTQFSNTHYSSVFFLTKGTVSFSLANPGGATASTHNVDFVSAGVPVFKNASTLTVNSLITHTIPSGTFPGNVNSSFGTALVEDWEEGAGIQYKIKRKAFTVSAPFVVLEASAVNESAFSINDCACLQFDSGKWVVYCTTGTDEVKRAQIYKTLAYGTDGSDPRLNGNYWTNLTAIKTSVSRDVSKRFTKIETTATTTGNYTGTFSNTTTNNSCSAWGKLQLTGGNSAGTGTMSFEIPSSTSVFSVTSPAFNTNSIDVLGTNEESDEKNNPATCRIIVSGNSGNNNGKVIILHAGTISWANSGFTTATNTFFNNVPEFTLATETPEVTEDETDWLNINIVENFSEIIRPNTVITKLIPSSTATAGVPSLKGFSLRCT